MAINVQDILKNFPSYGTGATATNAALAEMLLSPTSDEITLRLNGEKDGTKVEALFKPEPNITVLENMNISLLLIAICSGMPVDTIKYLEKQGLLRHFTLKTK